MTKKDCKKLLTILYLLYTEPTLANPPSAVLQALKVPPGFKITLFADNVPNARTLALGEKGIIYVGTRQQGSIYALQDIDQDGVSDKRYLLGQDLNMPNGVTYVNGALYVAEIDRISRFDDITAHLDNPPSPKLVYGRLPKDEHHGWKALRIGPDHKLYTAVGMPCNICEPKQDIYGTLVRLNLDGSQFEILAKGIRNTVGFDWHPDTKELFFSENGRDYLGDDLPPEELNRWTVKGQHFGFPYCHAGEIVDPDINSNKRCGQFVAPAWKFKAHMAPLGMRFYTGSQFPPSYKNRLFVAQHGSWNRTKPHGYRVVTLEFNKQGQPISESVFIDGWLTNQNEVLGRPTDILQLPDGSLLIADDTRGVIYKVTYQGQHEQTH